MGDEAQCHIRTRVGARPPTPPLQARAPAGRSRRTVEKQSATVILRNIRPVGRPGAWDLRIGPGGVVESFDPAPAAAPPPPPGARVVDCAGRVLVPPLADMHVHLDKTLVETRNDSGTLGEAIDRMKAIKAREAPASILARARRGIAMAMARGTTRMRTHADVGGAWGLAAVEALLEARDSAPPGFLLQIVALGDAATEPDRLREAAVLGVDAIGGAPALSPDPEACVRGAFDLAESRGLAVDLHVDETDDPATRTLALVVRETARRGMGGRVVAGHCCSLDFMPEDDARRLMDDAARAGVGVVSLPSCNLVLIGRGRIPAPRGVAPVRRLLAAGVRVAFASDNVRDPFNPLGCYDLVKIANLGAHAAHMASEEGIADCLRMVGEAPSELMGFDGGLPRPGGPVEFVVFDSTDPAALVAENPPAWRVASGGALRDPRAPAEGIPFP